MAQPHQISRESGEGSRSEGDDLYEGAAYRHDERSDTETTFFESDIQQLVVSERRKGQLRRMLRRQEGETPGESFGAETRSRGQQNHEEWRRRQVCMYASRFGLTPHQKQRVKHLVMQVLDVNGFGSYSTEQVILAVINTVCREDGRWIEDEADFKQAVEQEGLDLSSMRSLRRHVRRRI